MNSPCQCYARTPTTLAGQSWVQVEGFCEKPGDQSNDEELCKISPVHCQGTKNYTMSYIIYMLHNFNAYSVGGSKCAFVLDH